MTVPVFLDRGTWTVDRGTRRLPRDEQHALGLPDEQGPVAVLQDNASLLPGLEVFSDPGVESCQANPGAERMLPVIRLTHDQASLQGPQGLDGLTLSLLGG